MEACFIGGTAALLCARFTLCLLLHSAAYHVKE